VKVQGYPGAPAGNRNRQAAPARAHVEAFQSARETVYPWPLSGQQAADPADVDAFAQLAPDRVPDDRAPAER
jgi:hypothetical protein